MQAHLHTDRLHPGAHRDRQAAGAPGRGRPRAAPAVPREREQLEVAVAEAADAVEAVVAEGVDAAMNRFNGAGAGAG